MGESGGTWGTAQKPWVPATGANGKHHQVTPGRGIKGYIEWKRNGFVAPAWDLMVGEFGTEAWS